MISQVPSRSARGCLTCKKRRKKCDEMKPFCSRCVTGGFLCLGYGGQSKATFSADSFASVEPIENISGLSPSPSFSNPSSGYTSETSLPSSPERGSSVKGEFEGSLILQSTSEQSPRIPLSIPFDPTTIMDLVPLIIEQCRRMSNRIFRPFPVEEGLVWRVNDSEITRWTMFIGAKLSQALSEGGRRESYVGWINRLHGIILGSPASHELAIRDVRARLSGLRELSNYATVISGNAAGYAIFKQSTPFFLQVASTFSHLWAPNSAIYISHALHCRQYEIRAFILIDTIMALAFGIPPLLVYETTPQVAEVFEGDRLLEWVHGCPAEILLVVARVNAWRAARWLEDNSLSVGGSPGSSGASESGKLDEGEWRTAEKILKTWKPSIEEIDGSANLVTRLAVQESWRQGVLIYLYMGICGVGSDDVGVQTCVKQVVQLARTVEEGALLEPHLFIPCLIAATAARHESHRALLRTKLRASRNEHIWILRGIDFVPVLDYLWHSTGAGGAPVRWDDYVRARVATLPIGT